MPWGYLWIGLVLLGVGLSTYIPYVLHWGFNRNKISAGSQLATTDLIKISALGIAGGVVFILVFLVEGFDLYRFIPWLDFFNTY